MEFFVELVESPLELTTTVVHICSIEESGVSFGASSLLSCISLFDLLNEALHSGINTFGSVN